MSYNSVVRASGGSLVAAPPLQAAPRVVRRGDARADGTVTVADALFIAQYLSGSRGLGDDTGTGSYTRVHPINAASPLHDDASGDKITIGDAQYISQMLAGLRDRSFNPLAATAAAIKTARSKTVATAAKTTVAIGSATVPPGATARIPITIKNINDGLGLGSYDLKLTFNKALIEVDKVQPGPFAPVTMDPNKPQPNLFASTTFNIDSVNGQVRLNAFQPGIPGPTGDVVVAFLLVTPTGPSGSTAPFKVSEFTLYNSGLEKMTAGTTDGMVTVK